MIKEILAISGKAGLYKLISRGANMLIVETIDSNHKRMPAYAADKVVSIADISIYTDDGEDTPLVNVFQSISDQNEGKVVDLNHRKASNEEIIDFFKKALPNYDPDRVRQSDMRKVLSWYNILAEAGINKFVEEESEKENA
ncbi:MAG: DUF5606 domain-containing protein [Bacteroidaceae bacterium]|nr:DUF5606 domain-containing protein [Bacteroidaceae bacterium]